MQNRHKLRRLSLFYKIYKDQPPLHLCNLIPAKNPWCLSITKCQRNPYNKGETDSFPPATITEWNDLNHSLRTAPPINVFKQSLFASVLIKFYLQPAWSKVFIETPSCHLRGHKFHHNFSACLDEICICGKDIESTNHFLLQSSLFLKVRQVLIKFVILTAHLLTKMKTLSVIHFFLVKKT